MKFFPRTNDLFDDVFDDMFTSPFFSSRNDMVMKTDISEKDGYYLLDMELPGCKKEDIQLELHDGYLNVSAAHNTNKEEKDDKGNITCHSLNELFNDYTVNLDDVVEIYNVIKVVERNMRL